MLFFDDIMQQYRFPVPKKFDRFGSNEFIGFYEGLVSPPIALKNEVDLSWTEILLGLRCQPDSADIT